jgi:hypothetical protein
MAGIPKASVDAAVMKSAAGAAANAPASMANQFQTNAIASDMSVMADQAGTYARRTAEGNAEQESMRAEQSNRLAQEAAQAAQARANDLEMQRLSLQESQTRAAMASDENARRLAAAKTMDKEDDRIAKYEDGRDTVLNHALRNEDATFTEELNSVVEQSGSYADAMDLFDNMDFTSDRSKVQKYLRQIYGRAALGKNIRLGQLPKKAGRTSPTNSGSGSGSQPVQRYDRDNITEEAFRAVFR